VLRIVVGDTVVDMDDLRCTAMVEFRDVTSADIARSVNFPVHQNDDFLKKKLKNGFENISEFYAKRLTHR
jgi:hypothetical protein